MLSTLPQIVFLMSLALVLASALCAHAGEPEVKEPQIQKIMNVEFSKEHTEFRKIDIFLPGANRNGACIFFIHGGGWRGGNKEQWHAVMEHFCRLGYVCTSTDYRLAPEWPFPAQVEDVRLALSFVKERAGEYGFDPNRVGAMGSSAGAHLVAMLATIDADEELGMTGEVAVRDTKPDAAVILCGVLTCHLYECETEGVPKMLEQFLGVKPADNPELASSASPIDRLDGDESPFLMVVGDADPTTPVALHEAFRDRVAGVGGHSELVVLPGVKHGFGYGVTSEAQKKTISLVAPFFEKTLLGTR